MARESLEKEIISITLISKDKNGKEVSRVTTYPSKMSVYLKDCPMLCYGSNEKKSKPRKKG